MTAQASQQGIVQVIVGDDRRSWGILVGQSEAPGPWILPAAWKTRAQRLPNTGPASPAFPTPPWTARAPPTGSTGAHNVTRALA
jgi:hypothetical protein